MSPVAGVVLLSALFVSSHVLLAVGSIRRLLVNHLGEVGFRSAYSLVAWITFGATLFFYDQHRLLGPPGLNLPELRLPAIVSVVAGLCLLVSISSPTGYADSPMAIFSGEARQPRGMERITRHPMFAGMALFGLGHCLLAATMTGVAYFGFLVVLGVGGGMHQDRKLASLRGPEFQGYLESTSAIPFLAIARGRQTLVPGELPWVFIGLGLLVSWGTRAMHGSGFAWTAHLIFAAMIVGPIVLTAGNYLKHGRRPKAEADS